MRPNPLKQWLRLLAAASLLCLAQPSWAGQRIVLIASVRSPVNSLNSLNVQKLFLGLTVSADGTDLHALRNESDDFLRQIFYQNVISMSEPTYERRLLAWTLQQGRTTPPIYRDTNSLLAAIALDPLAVSFAWESDVARDPRIKILRILWQE